MSLIGDLWRIDRSLAEAACPGCGGRDRLPVLRRDRYFLAVEVSLCNACGLVHTARHLPPDAAERFYRDIYSRLMVEDGASPRRLETARRHAAHRFQRVNEVIGGFGAVLEIGCGLGCFLDECRRHGVERYHAVEPNAADRRYASEQLGLAGHVSDEVVEHLAEPPFAPDVVVMFHVLEHVDDPGALLRRLRGWLGPAGWLVLEVPDILGEWGTLGLQNFHISHRGYFSAETLGGLLAGAGFAVRRVERGDGDGIYPGNLRVFAAPGDAERPPPPPARQVLEHIGRRFKPWSPVTGYPRALLRLLRLTIGV